MRKQILILTTLLCLIGSTVACNDNSNEPTPTKPIDWGIVEWEDCDNVKPEIAFLDCMFKGFIENFTENFRCDKIYFIKGVAQNFIHEHGLNIKIIEDLKGNFPKGVTTFTTWGAYNPHNAFLNRCDDLSVYNRQDTLIMLLQPAHDYRDYPSLQLSEKIGDYTTMDCATSVLKLSNGYATGYILLPRNDYTINNMPYNELIEVLKLKLKE